MWTPISNLPSPIGHGAAGLLGNRITVICNTNLEDKQGNSTFVYDIETDKWFQVRNILIIPPTTRDLLRDCMLTLPEIFWNICHSFVTTVKI